MGNEGRDEGGRYKRSRYSWVEERWDDGYVDNHGYFRVYRPDYPAAYGDGYAKRAHVAFWIHTGHARQSGEVIHHRNKNKLDDRFENLELKSHGVHSTEHGIKCGAWVMRQCLLCSKEFSIRRWRLRDPSRGRYCSTECYKKAPKSDATRAKHSSSARRTWRRPEFKTMMASKSRAAWAKRKTV